MDTFYFILPDGSGQQVLILPSNAGWTLPCCETPQRDDRDLMDTVCFNNAVKEQFRADATTLYAIDAADGEDNIKIVVFENHSHEWKPPGGARWISQSKLDDLTFARPILKTVLETWFAEAEESKTEEPLIPWSRMGWFDEAAEWITDRIRSLGIAIRSPVQQVKSFYSGGTLRVNTDAGYIYFKAVSKAFIREPEIMGILTKRIPERVPVLLAINPERRWILVQDMGGTDLREVSEIEVWEDVLRTYAQIQVSSLEFMDEMLSGPFYDHRIGTIASAIDSVFKDAPILLRDYEQCLTGAELEALRAVVPQIKTLCDEIGSYKVPCTLEHGDLHSGNIRVTQNGLIFYDWSWSCVTHPFLGAAALLYKEMRRISVVSHAEARLRDAYLETWTAYEPLERLRELFGLMQRWQWVQAVVADAEWVAAYQQEISQRVVLPYSFTEWALRRRQSYLAKVFRRITQLLS